MEGAVRRAIGRLGREWEVLNATGGGGRDTATYEVVATVTAVEESRGTPTTLENSAGEAVEADAILRSRNPGVDVRGVGDADGYPTRYRRGETTYEVLRRRVDDSETLTLDVVIP